MVIDRITDLLENEGFADVDVRIFDERMNHSDSIGKLSRVFASIKIRDVIIVDNLYNSKIDVLNKVSDRLTRLSESATIAMARKSRELKAQGIDVISLSLGEPDFNTPDFIKLAANEGIAQNYSKYMAVNGYEDLRVAISAKFKRDNNLHYELDQIAVGSGTKQILFNCLMATVSKGDEIIIPAPYWASYPDMVQLAGGTPTIVNCSQNNQFKMSPEQLEEAITVNTKWLIFSSPSNPTGATYSMNELSALAEVMLAHPNVYILTDDVYEHLIYDGHTFNTIAEVEPALYERTVTCNGVSKGYSMTGWRVGFAGGPRDIIANMSKMQSQSTSGSSAVSQAAAIAALTGPQEFVLERTANLQQRRDILYDKLLNAMDFGVPQSRKRMIVIGVRKDIKNRTEHNTEVINIRQNRQDMIQYRKYDPLNYNGLNSY